MNIEEMLLELAKKRRAFHSEADFQHALAWEIHTRYPEAIIRLEYRPPVPEKIYLDLWVVLEEMSFAVELKYKTRVVSALLDGERHELAGHGAQDQGRYDFLEDVRRLELVTKLVPKVKATAILLTNDQGYWNVPSKPISSVDASFRVHEGKEISGPLAWGEKASVGTKGGRIDPIVLGGRYVAKWREYSSIGPKAGAFKYLLLDVVNVGRANVPA